MYKNHSDEDLLMHIAQKQSQDAFQVLYSRYAHLALGVCLKYLKDAAASQDAVQNIFIKIWQEAANYQVRQFRPWFYRVVKNHCLMELRKLNSTVDISENSLAQFMENDDAYHHKVKEEYLLVLMEECLKQLNEYQAVCVKYFYLNQKTYAETAELLDLDIKAVKTHLQNGRRNLKICVKQKWVQTTA